MEVMKNSVILDLKDYEALTEKLKKLEEQKNIEVSFDFTLRDRYGMPYAYNKCYTMEGADEFKVIVKEYLESRMDNLDSLSKTIEALKEENAKLKEFVDPDGYNTYIEELNNKLKQEVKDLNTKVATCKKEIELHEKNEEKDKKTIKKLGAIIGKYQKRLGD